VTVSQSVRWGFIALGAAFVAAAQTWLAYRTNTIAAFAAPMAATAAAWIFLRPMMGVYLAVLAIPLELFQVRIGSVGLSPTEVLVFLTALAAVAKLTVKSERGSSVHPAHAAFGGLIVVAALGLLVAPDTANAGKAVALWTSFLAISMLVASGSRAQVERVLRCLVIAGAVVGFVALLRTADPQLLGGGQRVANRAEGTFTHPNQLAFFLILTIPIAIALIGRGSNAQRVVAAIAACIATPALLLTFSRSGIIGLVVCFLVLLAWPGFRRAAIVAVVGIMMFSIPNLDAIARNKEISVLAQRLGTVTTAEGRSQNPRWRIYQTALQMVPGNPYLGVGARNFPTVSPRYGLRTAQGLPFLHAHNVFLTVVAETGLPGLVFFIGFVAAVAHASLQGLRRHGEAYPIILALASAQAGLLATGITEYPLIINAVTATILIQVGALVAYTREPRMQPRMQAVVGREVSPAAPVVPGAGLAP
jgi:putative inorganic carbon (HCO3(-)) transporter